MKFAVIVLAAGQSRRFGAANKLLAEFDGEPLIVRSVRQMEQVRVAGHEVAVYAVTGASDDTVARTLAAAGVAIVGNERALEGMGTSVAAGVWAVGRDADAVVIVLGDMPFVTAALAERLMAAFVADGGRRPVYPVLADGTQAHPVIWPRGYFERLCALSGDRGGKALLAGADVLEVPIDDVQAAADVDTPEDLARLSGLT